MRFILDVIRALFRIVGVAILALGLAAIGFLVAVINAGEGLAGQVLGRVWFQHDPFAFLNKGPSIQLVQVFFERKLAVPALWDPGMTTLLNWPAWLALGSFGLLCVVVCSFLFALTKRRSPARPRKA
jgi:hypothetical protein